MDAGTVEQVFKSIAIPIGFIILNTVVEAIVAAASGLESTDKTHRVLYVYSKTNKRVESLLDIDTVTTLARDRSINILNIERLTSIKMWTYPSVPINLSITSLSTYAVALFGGWGNETQLDSSTLVSILFVNLFVLVIIILLILVANQAKDGDRISWRFGSVEKVLGCRWLALFVSFSVTCITLFRFWSIV